MWSLCPHALGQVDVQGEVGTADLGRKRQLDELSLVQHMTVQAIRYDLTGIGWSHGQLQVVLKIKIMF